MKTEISGTLANGLSYRFRQGGLASPLIGPEIILNIAFKAGSAYDPPGKSGLAHVVEHLVRRDRNSILRDISKELDPDFLTYFNYQPARTELNHVHFCLSSKLQHFSELLSAVRQVFVDIPVSDDRVSTASGEVRREIEGNLRNHALGSTHERLYESAFPNHPYGRSRFGRTHDVDSIRRSDCETFLDHYYQPSRALIHFHVFGGEDDLSSRVIEECSSLFDSTGRSTSFSPAEVQSPKERLFSCSSTHQSHFRWHSIALGIWIPGCSALDYLKLELLSTILSAEDSHFRRLQKRIANLECHAVPTLHGAFFEVLGVGTGGGPRAESFGEDFFSEFFMEIHRLAETPDLPSSLETARERLAHGYQTIFTPEGWSNTLSYGRALIGLEACGVPIMRWSEKLEALSLLTASGFRAFLREQLRRENSTLIHGAPSALSASDRPPPDKQKSL